MSDAESSAEPHDPPPFEEALKGLQAIVEEMEAGEMSLEQMLKRYEEGVRLSKVCQSRLDEAEAKLAQLEQGTRGETVVRPIAVEQSKE